MEESRHTLNFHVQVQQRPLDLSKWRQERRYGNERMRRTLYGEGQLPD